MLVVQSTHYSNLFIDVRCYKLVQKLVHMQKIRKPLYERLQICAKTYVRDNNVTAYL